MWSLEDYPCEGSKLFRDHIVSANAFKRSSLAIGGKKRNKQIRKKYGVKGVQKLHHLVLQMCNAVMEGGQLCCVGAPGSTDPQ